MDLLHADPEDILRILLRNRRGRSWNEKKREHLLNIARQSLPDPQAAFAQRIAIRNYILLLQSYRAGQSDIQKHMQSLAKQLPHYHLLKSIPGVGPLTAATILAEIGDIKGSLPLNS